MKTEEPVSNKDASFQQTHHTTTNLVSVVLTHWRLNTTTRQRFDGRKELIINQQKLSTVCTMYSTVGPFTRTVQ